MHCPDCGSAMTTASERCPVCNYLYPPEIRKKLVFYFSLQQEFKNLAPLLNDFNARFKNISEKIRAYEELLRDDLTALETQGTQKTEPERKPEQGFTFEKTEEKAPVPEVHVEPERPYMQAPAGSRPAPLFELTIGQRGLLIIGIIITVFGVGYFLKYSFEQGWVGPAGRVAMAYLWGLAFLVAGNRFIKKEMQAFGLVLTGGGTAVLYFSTFAGFQIYGLIPQTPAFLIMILITVFACVMAVFYDTIWMAILGLIGGFLTPVMLSTGVDNQMVLMSYMTILNLGILGLAFYKRWPILNILGFICTYILFTGWFDRHYQAEKFWTSILFLNAFYLIYCLVPFACTFIMDKKEELKEFFIIIPNAFISFGFSYYMISRAYSLEWVSIVTILYAAMFLVMATYLYRRGEFNSDAFVGFLGAASLFLIITVPVLFSKHWITVFWAAQAFVLAWMGTRLSRLPLIAAAHVLFFIAAAKFLVYDYLQIFHLSVFGDMTFYGGYFSMAVERCLTSLALLILMERASALLRTYAEDARRTQAGYVSQNILQITWIVVLFISLNIESIAFFHEFLPRGTFAALSVLWTLFSVAFMIAGFKYNNAQLRQVSLVLFAVTILKVFLVDMSQISTPYRIISFIILGLFMVGCSYLYYKFKDRIINVMTDNRKEEK